MRTTIEFGGFYESLHSSLLDQAVESFCMDEDGNVDMGMLDDWDWCDSHYSYMLEWVQLFEQWISDEYGVKLNFTECELKSPKYYNFETDTIDTTLTSREVNDILDKFADNAEFDDYLRDATTSRSGFISFYDYDQAKSNKDGVQLQYLFRFLADRFNEQDLMDYYDRYNSYERVA